MTVVHTSLWSNFPGLLQSSHVGCHCRHRPCPQKCQLRGCTCGHSVYPGREQYFYLSIHSMYCLKSCPDYHSLPSSPQHLLQSVQESLSELVSHLSTRSPTRLPLSTQKSAAWEGLRGVTHQVKGRKERWLGHDPKPHRAVEPLRVILVT